MIATLVSFFGGNIFRMIFGEVVAFISKRQDHAQELERMRLQGELDAAQSDRGQAAIRLQAELGVKTIQVQAESHADAAEDDAWLEIAKGTTKTVGIWFLDVWNGIIRPAVATWAMVLISLHYYTKNWVLDDNGWSICGAALGIYLADRALFKRGK